jgi:hypothetical protein
MFFFSDKYPDQVIFFSAVKRTQQKTVEETMQFVLENSWKTYLPDVERIRQVTAP